MMFCFCRHCFAFIISVLVLTMGFVLLLLPSLVCFYHWRFGFDNGFLVFVGTFCFLRCCFAFAVIVFAFITGDSVSTKGFCSLVVFLAVCDDVLLLPSLFCFYH